MTLKNCHNCIILSFNKSILLTRHSLIDSSKKPNSKVALKHSAWLHCVCQTKSPTIRHKDWTVVWEINGPSSYIIALSISRCDISFSFLAKHITGYLTRIHPSKVPSHLAPKLPEPILLWKRLLPLYFWIRFLNPDQTIFCTI